MSDHAARNGGRRCIGIKPTILLLAFAIGTLLGGVVLGAAICGCCWWFELAKQGGAEA